LSAVSEILEQLKTELKQKHMTYKDLAKKLGLTEIALKRAFSKKTFTLTRIEEICEVLNLDMRRLIQPAAEEPLNSFFTETQELELAHDGRLFTLFYLLLFGLSLELIQRRYKFSIEDIDKLLLRLDKLGLIELGPRRHVRMRMRQNVRWQSSGPLEQVYLREIKEDFFSTNFEQSDEKLFFFSGNVTSATLQTINKKMQKAMHEIRALLDLDESEDLKRVKSVTFVSCYRPWVVPAIRKMRRFGE
jgi:transcriptional regulator with XRE-family HTH domain